MTDFCFSCRTLNFVIACCLLSPFSAQAQSPDSTPPSGVATPLNDLKAALPYVCWESRTRGPLLAITPEKVREHGDVFIMQQGSAPYSLPVADPAERQPLYAPSGPAMLDANLVARHFGRKLIRLTTLSIYAPSKMTVLNTHLQPPNPYREASLSENLRRLEATLTDAQWQMLGSPTGLGMGDVSKDQLPLFDAALPMTITLDQEATQDIDVGGQKVQQTVTIPQLNGTLSPQQRQQVRLHLERTERIDLVDEKNRTLPMSSPFHTEKRGTLRANLIYSDYHPEPTLFGQVISEDVPNRLKPSDLDLKTTLLQETWVPLTGVKTVGDILRAASKATRLDLHADDRLARLTVYVSTDARLVHASDLLEALCWSLTATYRKVGPIPGGDPKDFAYVLTYDKVGIAPLRGVIAEWARRGSAMRADNGVQTAATIEKANAGRYIQYASGDLLAPTKDAQLAAHESEEDQTDSGDYGSSLAVPVSALTAEQRQQMSEGLKQVDQINQDNASRNVNASPMTARTDRVGMHSMLTLAYVIPGVGEVPGNESWSDGTLAPEFPPDDEARAAVRAANRAKSRAAQITPSKQASPAPPAVYSAQIIVAIAPATLAEAKPMLAAASGLGVSAVWINAPNTAEGQRLIAACAASGEAHGIKVGAQVSLLSSPPDVTSDDATRDAIQDRNVYGETGAQWAAHLAHLTEGIDPRRLFFTLPAVKDDLFAAESPLARTLLAERLRAIAVLPGVTTLSLRDVAAPGRESVASANFGSPFDWTGSDFGYTVADRLTFLRQSGYDPIDLTSRFSDFQISNTTKLPRFDSDTDERTPGLYFSDVDLGKGIEDWHDYRAGTERELLNTLHTDLRKARPDLPIYLAPFVTGNAPLASVDIKPWDDAEPTPANVGKSVPASIAPVLPADKPRATIRMVPLSKALTAAFREGLSETNANSMVERTAIYIRNGLSPSRGQSKPSAPSVVVLDMTGIKTADALTLLHAALPLVIEKR